MTNEAAKPSRAVAWQTKRKPPMAAVKVGEKGPVQVEVSGDYDRMLSAIEHETVLDELVWQVSTLGSYRNSFCPDAANFVLGFVDSMKPKDAAETLLCAQMAAVHQTTMMMARRLNAAESIPQQDAAERALNKLGRTFAAQMDTLKRYRSKGQQVVRVERVTVESGAQAVVGSVESGGRGCGDN